MTTIAYRDGVLAADSMCTRGASVVPGALKKVHTLPNGSIAAFTGSLSMGNAFIRAMENGEPLPDLSDQAAAVVIDKAGRVSVYESNGWFEHTGAFGAWGSGMAPALGALHVGATAEEAVAAAIKVDTGSGGKVQAVRLKKRTKR